MFFLSWRQLISRKKQSLLILLGISLGTLIFVGISGMQLGLRKFIAEQLLNNTAHVLISGADRTIDREEVTQAFYRDKPVRWISPPAGKREEIQLENYYAWVQRLYKDPKVVDFSPRLTTNAILSNGDFTASVGLIGTVPERHRRITSIDKYMKFGSFMALRGGNNIIIGSKVAEELGARLDQTINVSGGRGAQQPFKVVGIVHFGNDDIDKTIAFADLTYVQTLTQSPGRVSEIAVALVNIDDATAVADRWQRFTRDKVQDWQEANRMFMEMIRVQDYVRYFITTAVLVVAAFGIYNVLTIMISQKRKEIAILRAIGYEPRRILQLILYQGLLLGVSGGSIGILLGFLLCLWIGSIDFGFEIGGSSNLFISYDWKIYVTAFVTANIASVFASYLPARAASRMTPMDIIRSEQ